LNQEAKEIQTHSSKKRTEHTRFNVRLKVAIRSWNSPDLMAQIKEEHDKETRKHARAKQRK